MRKNVYYLLLVVLSFIVLPSCKGDDDENTIVDYATEFAKNYDGYFSIEGDVVPGILSVERTGVNKIKLTLSNFKYGSFSIDKIVVDDVAVTKTDSIYFTATNRNVNINITGMGEQQVVVSIDGASLNETLNARLNITISGMTEMKVLFTTEDLSVIPAKGGEIWTLIGDGNYTGTWINNGNETKGRLRVQKIGGYKILLLINLGVFNPMLASMGEFPFTVSVTENPNTGVCTFDEEVLVEQMNMYVRFEGIADSTNKINLNITAESMNLVISFSSTFFMPGKITPDEIAQKELCQ
jgi:hypothetical protein